jgi:hypothetical protein
MGHIIYLTYDTEEVWVKCKIANTLYEMIIFKRTEDAPLEEGDKVLYKYKSSEIIVLPMRSLC